MENSWKAIFHSGEAMMIKMDNCIRKFDFKIIPSALFAVWMVVSFSIPRLFDAHNSYDHSWMSALSFSSSNKAFSYGPLAWIFLPDLGGIDVLKILYRIGISLVILFPVLEFFHKTNLIRKISFILGILFLLAAPYFKYDVMFYISFWFLALKEGSFSKRELATCLIWSFLAPLYKFSFLPLALILNFLIFLKGRENLKWVLCGLLSIIIGQTFIDSNFLAKFTYALGYSEYMAAHQQESSLLAGMMVILALLLGSYLSFFYNRIILFLLLAVFIQYKHAVVLGTPGYAFYLFFLPIYFLLHQFRGRVVVFMQIFSLWMIPLYIHYMGGFSGLFEKFLNSLVFKTNVPVVIQQDKGCSSKLERTLLLDYFGDAIGSNCSLKTFPSVQFYGFAPDSLTSKLNESFLNETKPNYLYFSPLTFGKRNFVSEMSYLLDELIKSYSLSRGEPLSRLSRIDTFNELVCSKNIEPSKLVYLKLNCVNGFVEATQGVIGLLYKYPEFEVIDAGKQNRVFYSSLKSGVHLYLSNPEDVYDWWNTNDGIGKYHSSKIVVKSTFGIDMFSEIMNKNIEDCLEVSFCQIKQRTRK